MLFLTTCTVLYVFLYSGQKCNAPAFLLQAASRNWMTVTRTIIIIIIIFIFSNNNDDALALQDGNGSYTADRWRHRASCVFTTFVTSFCTSAEVTTKAFCGAHDRPPPPSPCLYRWVFRTCALAIRYLRGVHYVDTRPVRPHRLPVRLPRQPP